MFDDDIANSCCEKICQNVTIIAGECIKYVIKRFLYLSNSGKCGKQVKYLTSEVTRLDLQQNTKKSWSLDRNSVVI